MAEYTKPWLPIDQQIDQLAARGLTVGDREHATAVIRAVGYYRLTGYLYPFRESESYETEGRTCTTVLDTYCPGTTLHHAEDIITFDRRLRMLTMEGIERIEVAARMQIGYVLGRRSAFSYEDPECFTDAFTAPCTDMREPAPSKHVRWLQRVNARKSRSDEQFVAHFRDRYDDRMPVWALTEILELGHLSTLYPGMLQPDAQEVADAFGVPTKKLMTSWLASLNYVRNVSATTPDSSTGNFSTHPNVPPQAKSRPWTTSATSPTPSQRSAPTTRWPSSPTSCAASTPPATGHRACAHSFASSPPPTH